MKKVFLAVKDNNTNFINRFLESFDNSYELTIAYYKSFYDKINHNKVLNINFNNLKDLSSKEKQSIFESILVDYDLIISNNISNISIAALNINKKLIQYSDLFMFEDLDRNSEVLFGKINKTMFGKSILSEKEKYCYNNSLINFNINPLTFFHNFKFKKNNILRPYIKYGLPKKENKLPVSISYSANKNVMNKKSINLSLIEDFGFSKNDFINQEYYNLLSESYDICIDLDYLLLGDCLFNNVRPDIKYLDKTLDKFFLYNFTRTLNLSRIEESIPFVKLIEEQTLPTLNEKIMELL